MFYTQYSIISHCVNICVEILESSVMGWHHDEIWLDIGVNFFDIIRALLLNLIFYVADNANNKTIIPIKYGKTKL